MINHTISDYFHFDRQFFHTLKPLLFKPGKLTTEYMAGHRVQYLHPVKMYIFISLVYFLLLFKTSDVVKIVETPEPTTEKITDSTKNSTNAQQKAVAIKPKPKTDSLKTSKFETYKQYQAAQQLLPESERDNFIQHYVTEKQFTWKGKNREWYETFAENFKHNIPKLMFLLLPLFALIVKIAFRKNNKFYVEHLIYSFHFHCFLFLFLSIVMLLQLLIPVTWIAVLGMIKFTAAVIIAWYMYQSLKVVYQRTRLRTITKIIGISVSYFIVFAICLTILAGLTALLSL
jgi:hypothetical protein